PRRARLAERLAGGGTRGLARQRRGAVVEDARAAERSGIDVALGDELIGGRIPIEKERPLAARAKRDEGDTGAGGCGGAPGGDVHSFALEPGAEERTELVITDEGHEPSGRAEARQVDRHVGGGTAEVAREALDAAEPTSCVLRQEIDDDLAEAEHV